MDGLSPFPLLIGVSGGSASGKTTLASMIQKEVGEDRCGILFQDSYYIDQSARFDGDGGSVNYDHPNSIDFDLMVEHLQKIRSGQPVEVPIYDFKSHRRLSSSVHFKPRPIVLIDGILIFSQPEVCGLFDHRIFVRTDEEERFRRRLERDVALRGRTKEGVTAQFLAHVKPMHDLYVEPSCVFAHSVVSGESDFAPIVRDWVHRLSFVGPT